MIKQSLQKLFIDLLSRLTSRTLWVAVITVAALLSVKQYMEAAIVASAYIGGEKVVDATATIRNRKATIIEPASVSVDDGSDVDKSGIVTGATRIKTFDERED